MRPCRFVGARARFEPAPAHVADAEREQLLRRHQLHALGADALAQPLRVLAQRVSLRNLERRPKP